MGIDRESREYLRRWEDRKTELRAGLVNSRALGCGGIAGEEFEEIEALVWYPSDMWAELAYHERQWLRVEAAAIASTGAVLTGRSAARKLGMWVVAVGEEKIEVTLPSRSVAQSRAKTGNYKFRFSRLHFSQQLIYEGHPVTTPIRTFIDIARYHGFAEGLVAADYLLRRGIDPEAIRGEIKKMGRAKGIAVARRCLAHAIPNSDSPYETLARGLLIEAGIGPIQPQHSIDQYYVDLLIDGWLIIEIDGDLKYLGPAAEKVRQAEFNRQKRIGNQGYVFLRFTPRFIRDHPKKFIAEVRQALAARGIIAERAAGAARAER